MSTTPAAQVERTRRLRRAFLRKYLRRKPTRLEAMVLDRAAALTALAEALAADPTAHPDSIVRAENLAARARRALTQLQRSSQAKPLSSFDVPLRSAHA